MQPKIHINLVLNPGEEKLDASKDRCPALEVHLLTFWVPWGGNVVLGQVNIQKTKESNGFFGIT